MSISGSGGKPNHYDPEFLKKLKDPELAKKMKDGMDLYRSAKNFRADPEAMTKKGKVDLDKIKSKYFDSEPTVESSDGKVKKLDKSFQKRIVHEDYSPTGLKDSKVSKEIPDAPTRIPFNPRISEQPPKDLPPLLPDLANEVLNPISKKTGSIKVPIVNSRELETNPRFMERRKKADYEGEIKQSPEAGKAEKEFAEKAGALGYRFDTDFEMYLPIKEGTKDALTKDEMTAMIEGKPLNKAASKPREVKYEGRTKELDDFALKETFHFNEEMGMYISSNPFSGDKFETIDEMKERMTSLSENKVLNEAAKKQGYSPMLGMDGLYQNADGDIKAADEFR